jgi:hypothetical protein
LAEKDDDGNENSDERQSSLKANPGANHGRGLAGIELAKQGCGSHLSLTISVEFLIGKSTEDNQSSTTGL